jgi:polygalacturonase
VTITDVTLYESCNWTLHLQWCENVKIRGINIYSDLDKGVNADGIDIDGCRDVIVSDCYIETGDDAIVLKSTLSKGKSQPCENVTVTNCVLTSTSTALKIGTETHSDFRHIIFDNCVIRNSNRGLSIVVRDGAQVSDVKFSNISMELNRKHFNWWGNADGIWLVVLKRTETSRIGNISNVTFDNISGDVQGTSRLEGFQGMPLKNIRLNNVHFRMQAETKPDKRATDGFRAHDVEGLSLTNCSVEWNEKLTEPKWASAFALENISNLHLRSLSGKQAPGSGAPAIKLTNISNAVVESCFAPAGTGTFIKITGPGTKNILLGKHYSHLAVKTLESDSQIKKEIK